MDHYHTYNGSHSSTNVSINDKNALKKNKKKSTKSKSTNNGAVATPLKLSTDPQSVAARERRHRISERFKTLQSLVPGGSKLDTVSMLDEAIHYVKFLKTQIWLHETLTSSNCASVSTNGYLETVKQQPCLDELHCPRSNEWSQSSWGYDDHNMAEVQFGYETTLF